MSLDQISSLSNVLTAVGAFVVAIIAYVQSQRIARLQALQTIAASWSSFNELILTNPSLRQAYRKVAGHTDSEDTDDWYIIYQYLDQAALAYHSHKLGGLTFESLQGEYRAVWRNIRHSSGMVDVIIADNEYPVDFAASFKTFTKKVSANA